MVLIYSSVFEFQAETEFWQVTKKEIAFFEIAFSFIYISSSWWFNYLFPAGLKKKIKSMCEFRFLASRFIKLVSQRYLVLEKRCSFPHSGNFELYHRVWKDLKTGLRRSQGAKLPASEKLDFTSQGKLRHWEPGLHLALTFTILFLKHGILTGEGYLVTSREKTSLRFIWQTSFNIIFPGLWMPNWSHFRGKIKHWEIWTAVLWI